MLLLKSVDVTFYSKIDPTLQNRWRYQWYPRLSHYFHNLLWFSGQGMWLVASKASKDDICLFFPNFGSTSKGGWRGGKRKALIVSKKVLKRAKKSSWLWQCGREAALERGGLRRTEAPKAVEIEAVSRGCFKSSWSLMRLERRRRNRPLTSRGFANNSKAF